MNRIFNNLKLFILFVIAFSFFGCKKETPQSQSSETKQDLTQTPALTPEPEEEEEEEKPVYIYSGDRFRDPFMPAGASSNYQAEAVFDPTRSTLRGVIFSNRYKSAILTIPGSGTFFIDGRNIFDVMGKTVKGFRAKVLVDRVIIVGEADNVFELKLRTEEDEEEKTL